MENKHTPGPWEKDYSSEDGIYIRPKGTGYQIALVEARSYRMEKYGSSVEADANLIASAPTLLKACEEALKCFEAQYLVEGRELDKSVIVRILREAISSSKGEAKNAKH
jgi:hypothetical protein